MSKFLLAIVLVHSSQLVSGSARAGTLPPDLVVMRAEEISRVLHERTFVAVVDSVSRVHSEPPDREGGSSCAFLYRARIVERLRTSIDGQVELCTPQAIDMRFAEDPADTAGFSDRFFVFGVEQESDSPRSVALPRVKLLHWDGQAVIPILAGPERLGMPEYLMVSGMSIFSLGGGYFCDAFVVVTLAIGDDIFVQVNLDRVRRLFDEDVDVSRDFTSLC